MHQCGELAAQQQPRASRGCAESRDIPVFRSTWRNRRFGQFSLQLEDDWITISTYLTWNVPVATPDRGAAEEEL